ncbi:tRNA (adenosine(37)-N6)-threonylcarbamoyltransferase complex ATPase subunit type 1 TsaE [Candidatus Gracilibacteria bacterium]|nr:tRNA (adenosine(37)-N6)-threonylcarbamoyltransferase complex ATPase subunit type 1 TsaE [Candidatus Gracilibacteria bacterium]
MKTILKKEILDLSGTKQFATDIFDILSTEKEFTVFLEGGLGAGKTVLIRELLGLFGIEKEITSPTYIFVNEYQTDQRNFAHFDFYRLPRTEEFFARGFSDIAEDSSISKFVEWPDKISEQAKRGFSGKKFTIVIDYGQGAGMRKMKFLNN